MAAVGGPTPRTDDAIAVAQMALDMQATMGNFQPRPSPRPRG